MQQARRVARRCHYDFPSKKSLSLIAERSRPQDDGSQGPFHEESSPNPLIITIRWVARQRRSARRSLAQGLARALGMLQPISMQTIERYSSSGIFSQASEVSKALNKSIGAFVPQSAASLRHMQSMPATQLRVYIPRIALHIRVHLYPLLSLYFSESISCITYPPDAYFYICASTWFPLSDY
jgi:hypothetical protein